MKLSGDPFGTDPGDVPETLQMELIDIQNQRAFHENDLLTFNRQYVSQEAFLTLWYIELFISRPTRWL